MEFHLSHKKPSIALHAILGTMRLIANCKLGDQRVFNILVFPFVRTLNAIANLMTHYT